MIIKAVTYNIQHCAVFPTGRIDFDMFAHRISSFGADVVGLNEVRGRGIRRDYEDQAAELAERTGMSRYFAKAADIGPGNPYGNALLTRLDVGSCKTIPIPEPSPKAYDGYYEPRCVLRFVPMDADVKFLITHFGLNPDEQESALETVLSLLDGGNTVLMGDLNVTPDSVIIEKLKQKMTEASFAVGNAGPTFPSDRPDRKIDYIFTSGAVRVRSCGVVPGVLSDHLALAAELEL
ncbi:MAG: endonuclease/exonuclease/phosphatase family protein [Clostridia bacterium]|nr:endonuclease/exonuclease/phosphatase family protein [Clostridia bacterium]